MFAHEKLTPFSVVGAYSSSRGLLHSRIFDNSIDSTKFKEFLGELMEMIELSKASLYMDNWAVHHSKTTSS